MRLVKLGGSVITYKGERPRFRRKVTERLAEELAASPGDLCIVHGGGSFGHPLARLYRLHEGLGTREALSGFARVHASMRELNLMVLRALHSRGLPAVSIPAPPLSTVKGGKLISFDSAAFREAMDVGLVPLTFGDVVLDPGRGSSILSGDDLMFRLAADLRPELAVFVADVEGVKARDGSLIPLIIGHLPDVPLDLHKEDVTGGLRRKLDLMLRISRSGTRCILLSGLVPGRLQASLEGREVTCTEVRWS